MSDTNLFDQLAPDDFDPFTSISDEDIPFHIPEPVDEIHPENEGDAEYQLKDLMRRQRLDPNVGVPVAFLTGLAGTGKTHVIRELIRKREGFGVLAATTGIAAVNLGAVTINSLLKYFDTESLQDRFASGALAATLHKLAHEYENLVIDEVSMMDGRQLKYLYHAVAEVNEYESMTSKHRKLGIILTGDFCQLSPVPDKKSKPPQAHWVFEQPEWEQFRKNTIRLTKIWRQDNAPFLKALNHLRSGEGKEATEILKDLVTWKSAISRDFDGTTIVATNTEVENHNRIALWELPGESVKIPSRSWGVVSGAGREKGEFKLIPEVLEIKLGAYVMILANKTLGGSEIMYANGDCGHVVGVDVANKTVNVMLVRNGRVEAIPMIERYVAQKDDPSMQGIDVWDPTGKTAWDGKSPYYHAESKRYRMGGLRFVPLRLAYAATVHKTQGLTLDRIQVDSRAHFFGQPGMAYVALSRARDPKNVQIVGLPKLFPGKVSVNEKVREWL